MVVFAVFAFGRQRGHLPPGEPVEAVTGNSRRLHLEPGKDALHGLARRGGACARGARQGDYRVLDGHARVSRDKTGILLLRPKAGNAPTDC